MIMKINKKELCEKFHDVPFRLIFGLSFDQRSLNIFEAFQYKNPKQIIALTDPSMMVFNDENILKFQNLSNDEGILVGMNSDSVLDIADELYKLIQSFDKSIKTIIDITALSNELLSILMAVLRELDELNGITLCYTGAVEYSYNLENSDMWLSKGVSSVRSVLGYPGVQLPSQPLHLVIMTGFEVERAFETINRFEPAILSLGIGSKSESISSKHHEKNIEFSEKLEEFIRDQELNCENLNKFQFSCVDPYKTRNNLRDHLSGFSGSNTIICPLNTKISTVGASLYCFDNPDVQLCYTQPMEYNLDGYARAGELITFFAL